MATQVVLTYDVDVGLQPRDPGSAMFIKVANVVPDPGAAIEAFLGLALVSIVPAVVVGKIRVVMTYSVRPQGNLLFPTDALLQAGTRHLFGKVYEAQIPARVTDFEPVVT